MSPQYIHPNTPPRLVRRFHKAGSFHKLAEERRVNIRYVYELITQGIEPNDTTPKLREIRTRLYLRKHKPRGKPKPSRPLSPADKGIRRMLKDLRTLENNNHGPSNKARRLFLSRLK